MSEEAGVVSDLIEDWVELTIRNMTGEELYFERVPREERVLSHIMRMADIHKWRPASIQLLFEDKPVPAGPYDIVTQGRGLKSLTFVCIFLNEPELYDESCFCDVCDQYRFCHYGYGLIHYDAQEWHPVTATCENCGGQYSLPPDEHMSDDDANMRARDHEYDTATSDSEMNNEEDQATI